MPSVRRVAALGVAVVALGAIVVLGVIGARVSAVRSGRSPVLDGEALAAAIGDPEGPALVLFADPDCPACGQALDDLRVEIRPEEFGVRGVVLLRADPATAPLFERLGPGLLPAYVLLDGEGRPLRVVRGYRPAAWMRRLLRDGPSAASPGDPP